MDKLIEKFINDDVTEEEVDEVYKFFNISYSYCDNDVYVYAELTLQNTQMDNETVDYMNHFLYLAKYPYCLTQTETGVEFRASCSSVNNGEYSNIGIHTAIFNYLLHKNNKLFGKICASVRHEDTNFTVYCDGDNVRVEDFMKEELYKEHDNFGYYDEKLESQFKI